MPFFSKVFGKDGAKPSKAKKGAGNTNGETVAPPKPRWEDAWARTEVTPEEIQELIHECTREMKSRALDMPFLLLPFRPDSDAGSARVFIGRFFKAKYDGSAYYSGVGLQHELRLTEPIVLCSLMKWCWSRLPGGVVTWDVYEMFKMGEQDSDMKRHAFETFIPLAVGEENKARRDIIFDFFDLLAAIAARGKANGLGGRKLSRMAGWWAFEHSDQGTGFDGGYRSWQTAADATSHLFFAYLRSLAPEPAGGVQGISQLPRSLQSLLSQTEYPPERPVLMYTTTPRVVMIVDSVSPTPFALLRRAKNFEYRDDDVVLQAFSAYEDPVKALTDECRRVLNAISRTNQSEIIENGTGASKQDPSWSKFEDLGFSGLDASGSVDAYGVGTRAETASLPPGSIRNHGQAQFNNIDRPTTPSWADFMSTGFADDRGAATSTPMLLPPDKVLPPIGEAPRGHSSQSHVRPAAAEANLEPGELASITTFELDDTFWWVWMTSLAGEETAVRKAVFGRCALIEANASGRRWLVLEEQVKGASPGPEEGAYIAEKRSRFSLRGRLSSRKSVGKKASMPLKEAANGSAQSKAQRRITIGADQQASIKAAAAKLKDQNNASGLGPHAQSRQDDASLSKTQGAPTLPTQIMSEAGPAMQWAKAFDRGAIKDDYMNNPNAGKGKSVSPLAVPSSGMPTLTNKASNRDLPALPKASYEETAALNAPTAAAVPQRPITPPSRSPSPPVVADIEKPAIADHPAIRQENISHPADQPTADNLEGAGIPKHSTSSPESAMGGLESSSKLRKDKPTGLKKFFTKKEKKSRDSKATTGQVQPIFQEFEESRPVAPGKVSYEPEPETEVNNEPERDFPDIPEQFQPQRVHEPALQISRTHTQEERAADQEFARFDQGPLDNMPAFAPPESPIDAAPAPPEFGHPASSVNLRPAPVASPLATPSVLAESDTLPNVAEEPAAPEERQGDRWAQIHKDARERAQRMSEEPQSAGQSAGAHSHSQSYSKTTDDGDTSGEETIESRVARIKARVAELTGNMESSIAKR